jgi:hypothetical protein
LYSSAKDSSSFFSDATTLFPDFFLWQKNLEEARFEPRPPRPAWEPTSHLDRSTRNPLIFNNQSKYLVTVEHNNKICDMSFLCFWALVLSVSNPAWKH